MWEEIIHHSITLKILYNYLEKNFENIICFLFYEAKASRKRKLIRELIKER